MTATGVLLWTAVLATAADAPDLHGDGWRTARPGDVGMDAAPLAQARDYALSAHGSGCILRKGACVMEWGDPKRRYGLKSSTKAIGVTALGLAVADGKIALADKARKHHPEIAGTGDGGGAEKWVEEITIFHLATQTAGYDKGGGSKKLLFRPGTKWSYSDSGPNWLAECVTLAYAKDVRDLLFDRVFKRLGITPKDLTWRSNSYRPKKIAGVMRREFGSGISANVRAMARIGQLYLRGGKWNGEQLIPAEFVDACGRTPEALRGLEVVREKTHPDASDHYGLLWWNNADGTLKNVPRDAYWSWGLYDSLILVIPSLDVVAARAGRSWKPARGAVYDKLAPFFDPIVAAVRGRKPPAAKGPAGDRGATKEPAEGEIASIEWAPSETVVRKARGSDNWPMTWADDGHQYTAWGDGWGFRPRTKRKLSLGVARIEGPPDAFRGVNVRTPTGEQLGDGRRGKKASGLLCLDGVLYMLVRNAKLSQLAWSADHGWTWQWADWRFERGLAHPTFVNFGRDCAGARDAYVYIASFDGETAYKPSDRMILARVPADRIRRRDAYEFFVRRDGEGGAVWSGHVRDRGAVLECPGKCYRGGVSYNAPLKRYLWTHTTAMKRGGLIVWQAPEPWGPWTVAWRTDAWDIDPGEAACLPTKWMSPDGRTVHLVFSGDDSFAVRKGVLALR